MDEDGREYRTVTRQDEEEEGVSARVESISVANLPDPTESNLEV